MLYWLVVDAASFVWTVMGAGCWFVARRDGMTECRRRIGRFLWIQIPGLGLYSGLCAAILLEGLTRGQRMMLYYVSLGAGVVAALMMFCMFYFRVRRKSVAQEAAIRAFRERSKRHQRGGH